MINKGLARVGRDWSMGVTRAAALIRMTGDRCFKVRECCVNVGLLVLIMIPSVVSSEGAPTVAKCRSPASVIC